MTSKEEMTVSILVIIITGILIYSFTQFISEKIFEKDYEKEFNKNFNKRLRTLKKQFDL